MLINFFRKIKDYRFFSRQEELANAWQRIAWWELRRLPYNLVVGASGVASVALIVISGAASEKITGMPLVMPDPPLFALVGMLLYGILANACYTGGWIAELFVAKVWGRAGKSFGEITFTLGLIFSALLTLFIGVFFSGLNVIQILLHLAGYTSSEF